MEDRQIVALFLRRDQQAIEETAEKYADYCYSIAYGILCCPEDAEEAVNDVYIGAWNAIPPHEPVILSTFLGKITRRIAIKRWHGSRAQKRGQGEMPLALEELAECIPSDHNVEREIESAELSRMLNRFVLALPQPQRNIFICRYWHLDPIRSIARRFGFSQSKVKSMLSRTRAKLLDYLQKEGYVL